jgi:hypothetical protein
MVLVGTSLIVGLILWFVPESVPARNPILLIIVALPMILGILPRNRLYGTLAPLDVVGRGVVSPERDRRNCVARLGPRVARDGEPLEPGLNQFGRPRAYRLRAQLTTGQIS